MELKDYQLKVIEDLETFLEVIISRVFLMCVLKSLLLAVKPLLRLMR